MQYKILTCFSYVSPFTLTANVIPSTSGARYFNTVFIGAAIWFAPIPFSIGGNISMDITPLAFFLTITDADPSTTDAFLRVPNVPVGGIHYMCNFPYETTCTKAHWLFGKRELYFFPITFRQIQDIRDDIAHDYELSRPY